MFAVIDTETTGLCPSSDRIVEVAVVEMDARGRVQSEWATLVDPGRDVGPSEIHGISNSDVAAAPLFGEVAAAVAERVSGRVIVGHNVGFDWAVLEAEFTRTDHVLPVVAGSVCTWSQARQLGVRPASLENCLSVAGVVNAAPHSALGDARATAELWSRMRVSATVDGWSSARSPACR